MTQPQDPRKHPLQDDEIALARVLRALPAGEPPASVDAAILRAATDAVAPGRRRPPVGLRWLPTWAIGTAAAAVLAVGIGLQLRPPLHPESAPAPASEAAKPLPPARERLSVDLVEPDQALPPPAAPPPSAQRPARGVPAPPPPAPPPPPPREPEAFPAPQAAAPAPEPAAEMADPGVTMDAVAPAAAVEESESRLRSEDNDQARRLHQEAFARRAQAKASAQAREESAASGAAAASRALNESAPVAPAAMAAPAPAAPASAEAMADVVGQAAILPPVADDARLAPDAWLDRVRERRRQGDTAGARASLRLFLKAHPDAPIPSDLASLR